ncbi:glutathione-disulfide reductase [Hansschlegelia sp.]|uniref:glutathione-disulfide reductase n=1 Tax=Hansschlegelia sp. TaxID=2041892 RepID=UPI002B832D5D|nr:glutathione-disulfide reductase [Hansschlegelia sp.]HVI28018.1 glutathione-disulfide reductase [Hansschlegelia sp.]
MSEYDVDLFVIGAGSGGVRAARVAAGYGARVAIAEEFRIGGTCVVRGCVPKKLLVYASRFPDAFEDAQGFGWSLPQAPQFSWPALIAAKDREIARLSGLYEANLERSNVIVHQQRAVIDGPHAVRLADGGRITAGAILIATGGHPVAMEFPGLELAISSNEALDLAELPERIVIQGGGYIAVEFASVFAALGVETILIHRGSKVLRGFDEDLRDDVQEAMARRGVKFLLNDHVVGIEPTDAGKLVRTDCGETLEASEVMMAIGRRPLTAGLGLESVGLECDHKGAVAVDAFSRTSVPSIYAIGDVTNRMNLTPIAIREGHALADTLFGGRPTRIDYANVPTAVFTTPEIGTVGLSEEQALEGGGAIDIYKTRFRPMKATLSGAEDRMLMKLVVDAESDRVLGVHVLGEDAAEIIQVAAIAVKMGATKADFDQTVALHPTASEELVTLRTKWTGV